MYQLSAVNNSAQRDQLICPIPHRMAISPCTSTEIYQSSGKRQSCSMAGPEGEASFEILDIFLSKSGYGDQTNVNSSLAYFCGSPPNRSDNPLVHDVQFARKGLPPSPVIVSQKSSCGAVFGGKPSVRVEGFVPSSQKSHCSVPALA